MSLTLTTRTHTSDHEGMRSTLRVGHKLTAYTEHVHRKTTMKASIAALTSHTYEVVSTVER